MGTAAILLSLAAGGTSYIVETRRAEQAAITRALEGARHFESPAMQVAISTGSSSDHEALNHLLDRNQFVGVRVFGPDKSQIYESWADIPLKLITSAKSRQLDWPGSAQSSISWIEEANEKLILVMLPMIGSDEKIAGYLQGVSRLDGQARDAQQVQIRNGALTAVVSALVTAMLLYPLLLAMLKRSAGLSGRLLDANLSLMRSLGNAVAKRDSDTDAHNYRVTLYAVALAEVMSLPGIEIADLVAGAFLHDVGKIGIPDSILLKPGKLTDDEFQIMKTHALLGVDIVADNPWLTGAAQTIRHHHERYDGTGYPDKLVGETIPRIARIFAVVDVFDALTSERPYKKPMALADALAIIERDSGRHFDPKVVAAFIGIAPDMFAKTVQASSTELRQEMHSLLSRYFQTEAAPEGAASRSEKLGD
jgi:HD-GYP domain-containing protein (c-di-GMP phosphodiesterase class II)